MGQAVPSGVGLKRAGIALFIFGMLLYAAAGDVEENPLAMATPLVSIAGALVYFRGRQQAARARAESSSSPLRDAKPHVLYLRSFAADPSTLFKQAASAFTTEEEQLADVLRPFGELIAIGRPGEKLPLPGAVRMYATDAEWQQLVLDRMRSAPLVVIRAGVGAGISWEVGQAFATLSPKRILILVLNLKADEYRVFADEVRQHTRIALPAIGEGSLLKAIVDVSYGASKAPPGFIMFSDDWSPAFLPFPFTPIRIGINDMKKAFNLALRPVFERHGLEWHPARRFERSPPQ